MIHAAKDAYKWQWRWETTQDFCSSSGWESKECQQAIDIYDKQYAASKIGQVGGELSAPFFKIAIAVIILGWIIYWVIPRIMELYQNKQ